MSSITKMMTIPKPKTFRNTIAHAILQQCKVIASATGVPSNDLVRTCLSVNEVDGRTMVGSELDEAVNRKFFHAMEEELHTLTGSYSTSITNRPKANRFSGDCYINAYAEWKQTGNEPVIGWEATLCGRFITIVPHAFNKDADGNYYDTANNYKAKGGNDRPCWVRCSGDEAKDWLTQFAKYYRTNDKSIRDALPCWTDVWGGLGVIIHTDNQAYMVRSKGLTTENVDKDYSYHKTIDCSA